MIFSIGTVKQYRVRIMERITDDQGHELYFCCNPRCKEIRVMASLPLKDRRIYLRQAHWYAWCNHNPRPTDEESEAIMFATVNECFDADFKRQGGNRALAMMQPESVEVQS